MMKNLYISTTFIHDNNPLFESLELCNQAGIQSVEIGSNHCFEENYNYVTNYPFQYIVHNYFPVPKDSFVINIASFNENIRAKSIQHIKDAIDFCNVINAKLYTFHPGFLSDPAGPNHSKSNYDFIWKEVSSFNYNKAIKLMYDSLDQIIFYAKSKQINIAIETEGSFHKKDHLLMQKPEEYQKFMTKYFSNDIGINLNIGHLNLACNAFNFKREDFIDLIKDHIVAMELSHNDGIEDQHLPLQKDEWYWDLILDPQFEKVYKILEFRNTAIDDIVKNIKLFDRALHAI